MGVVFSIRFAGGVLLMEQAAASNIDLDAECVLYGQLEDILWLAPTGLASLLDPVALAEMPREVVTLAAALRVTPLSVGLVWKELQITSFYPELVTTLRISATATNLGLNVLVGLVSVVDFEDIGRAHVSTPANNAQLGCTLL